MGSTSGQNQNVEKCDVTQCYIKGTLSSLSRKMKEKKSIHVKFCKTTAELYVAFLIISK